MVRKGRIMYSIEPGQALTIPDMGDWHMSCNEGAALVFIEERGGDEDDPWIQRLERGALQQLSRLKAFKKEAPQ